MGYDNLRLEKGMYRQSGMSFTQVLESLDPSENYRGTALEGTDAFQRQLKRFGIRARGAGSSPVETKAFDCVDHNKLWKILKEMGIPDHLTCLLRNLYAGQEVTVYCDPHSQRPWHSQ